jgi:choline dehydrogenase-like flavoprotein
MFAAGNAHIVMALTSEARHGSIRSAHSPEPLPDHAEFIVIGSGAAGSVVAAELSEAGHDVLVLEEGPHVEPERYSRFRPSESMRHLWRDGGLTAALGVGNSPTINVMMGRCIGGSSVLTGGVCFRTPPAVLHEWQRDLGLYQFSEALMAPYFEEVERAISVHEVPIELRSRSTTLFAEGAQKLGISMQPLQRNTKGCRGCGRCNFGCPHNAKLSVDVTYLPRALRTGARVLADAEVERLEHDAGRINGVWINVRRGEQRIRHRIRARHVVLAAGAFGSPVIMMKSGLSAKLTQVGKNMTLHPAFRVMAEFPSQVRGWQGALQSAYSDAFTNEGITLVGLFVPPGVLAATMPGIGPRHHESARSIPHLSIFGGLIHDQGGGRIQRIFGRTLVTYRMSAEDRAKVPLVLQHLAEIYFAAGAKRVFLPILGLAGVTADQFRKLDLKAVKAVRLECSSQHPLGTCRIGRSAADSVVDAIGNVWGVEGLTVADGSVIPTSLGVNPQLSVMTMALYIARALRDAQKTRKAPRKATG